MPITTDLLQSSFCAGNNLLVLFLKNADCVWLWQFLNTGILVKKPAKLPDGHINTWFWEKGNMEDTLKAKVPKGAVMPIFSICSQCTCAD